MAEHIVATPRIEASALHAYIRKRVEPIYRKSALMNELKKRGRITFNHGGDYMEWRPRIKRRDIVASNGNDVQMSFPRVNTKMKVSLPWRAYQLGESITKYEKLVTQNKAETFFKIAEDTVNELSDDFVDSFRHKLYLDGNATGSKDIHGLESIFSVNGALTNSPVGNNNDSYATKATTLGSLGGDWEDSSGSTIWPLGTGDTQYCAWTPLVVDYQNTAWTASTKTWANTWREAIRYATTYMGILQSEAPDILLINPELLRKAKDSLEENDRFTVEVGDTTDVGFKKLTFEGLTFVEEYGVPSDVCYLINFDKLELRSMQKQLVMTEKDTDITTKTELISLDFYGNLLMESPAYFGKLAAISALGT
jgi:hypothetical protein